MNLNNFKIWCFIIIGLIYGNIHAQTNEVGLFLGGSIFHGDIGYTNAENALFHAKPAVGIQVKRNFNYHFGIHLSFNQGELYAHDNASIDPFHLDRNLHFKSKISELSILLEFNFRPYLSRDADYNTSPFIFTGLSKFYFNPQGLSPDGNWYNLQPLNTEGQGTDLYLGRDIYKLNGLAIPIGLGYKINIYEFITLAFSVSWRITFTDYIDDVSTTYVEESLLGELSETLANQSYDNFTSGFQRGNPYNNDKYGFIGVSILYSIKDPDKGCNNIIY